MDPRPLSPSAAAAACGSTVRRLWIDYLALGGSWSIRAFEDYLARSGASGRAVSEPRSPDSVQRDVVAHTLNEALMDAGHPGRVPSGHTWGWPADPTADPPVPAVGVHHTHPLSVVPRQPGGPGRPAPRVLTSVPRGDQLDHELVCGRCAAVLAWSHRPPVGLGGLLRCPACRALNDPTAAA